MADTMKQTQELVRTWADAQKKMWNGWFKAVQSLSPEGAGKSLEEERKKILDTWETSVDKALVAQKEWMTTWAEQLGETRGAEEWAKQSQEVMKTWTDSQESFVKSWFEATRKIDSGQADDLWETQGKQVLEAWQEAAEKALKAQEDMANLWAGEQKQSGKKKA